jgi:hypothetical protein
VITQLAPRLRTLGQHGVQHDIHTTFGLPRTDAFLLQAPLVGGDQLGGRERLQPPIVVGGDEVQRAAVEPGDQQAALRQSRIDIGSGHAGRAAAHR